MPNVGRPSPNCHLCRQRRVKCDLSRPGCLRCERYGVDCPGYRREGDIIFKTPQTINLCSKLPTALASKGDNPTSILAVDSSNPAPGTSLDARLGVTLPLPRSSIAFLMQRFSVGRPGGIRYPHMEFLSPLLGEARQGSCLLIVCNGFQEICESSERGFIAIWQSALWRHSRMANAVREALTDPQQRASDATLLGIFIFSTCEVLIGSPSKDSTPALDAWNAHVRGLLGVVQLRGTAGFNTTRGRDLFWMGFGLICLITGVSVPPMAQSWLVEILAYGDLGDVTTSKVCSYINSICHIICRALALLEQRQKPTDSQVSVLSGLFDDIENADEPTLMWLMHGQPDIANLYGPFSDPYQPMIYCGARCKAHHLLVCAYDRITQHMGSEETDIQARLEQKRALSVGIVKMMAEGLLNSAVSTLKPVNMTGMASSKLVLDLGVKANQGWREALRLLWPLGLISQISTTTAEQKYKAHSLLAYITEKFGFRGMAQHSTGDVHSVM
ncbi:hypothetical protein BX600DRAFT_507410 [Xylariales sp. PMI_506]|nr:hypothetical protein BX600DRAFT_507410 [Xylariales sp. PMI_506]